MKIRLALSVMCFAALGLSAQSFQVFKGDTINRRGPSGKQEGVWRKYYKNDTLASEMFFKLGRHIGTFRTFSGNGKLQSEIKYRPGLTETGDAKLYYEDGTVKASGKYINKVKDSTWTYYDEKGNMISTEFYFKGKQQGIAKVYFPDGKIAEETVYKDGVKNGPHKEYYPDGQKKVMANNKNGEYEGYVYIYYPSGVVNATGRYVNGLREGKWTVNKPDGKLDHEEIYKNGKIQNPEAEKEERLDENVIKGPDEK